MGLDLFTPIGVFLYEYIGGLDFLGAAIYYYYYWDEMKYRI